MLRVGEAQFDRLRCTFARGALADVLTAAGLATERSDSEVVAVNAVGGRTRFTFDERGFVSGVEAPGGRRTTLVNDRSGKPLRIVTGDHELAFSYSARGKMASASVDGSLLADFVHDEAGRIRDVIYSDGTRRQIQYDEAGRVVSMSDRLGRTERFDWSDTASNARIFDGEGRRTLIELGESGRPRAIVQPDGTRQTYAYDPEGNLARIAVSGRLIATIDAHPGGKPAVVAYADGQTLRFTYDGMNRLVKAEASGTTISFEYDEQGRVIEERQGEHVVRYVYNALGALGSLVYPSGRTVDLSYGADATASELRDWDGGVFRFEASGDGSQRTTSYPSGLVETTSTDGHGRATSVRAHSRDGFTAFDVELARDKEGRVTDVRDSRMGDRLFAYDAEGQLVAVRSSRASLNERFAYDAAGNRVWSELGSAEFDVRDRVVRQGEIRCAWDVRGNLVELSGPAGSCRFRYDARNLLIAAEDALGRTVTFGYDALARRAWKRTPESVHHYVWAGDHLIAETSETASGTSVREHVYMPGSNAVLASRIDGRVYACHVDHLGTPVRMTDAHGAIVWAAEYTAFGRAKVVVSSVRNDLRFAGHLFDEETGLHYNRFRYYSPELGRYTTQDPVTYIGGLNFYAYAHNDPINASDPLGLWSWKSVVSVVAAVAVGVAVTAAIIVTAPVSLPALAVTAAAVVAGGAAAGAVGFGLNEALNQETLCLSCILKEAARGAGIGAVASLPFAFLPLSAGVAAFMGAGAVSGAIGYGLDVATNPEARWSWKDFAISVGLGAATAGVGRFLAGRYTQWRSSRAPRVAESEHVNLASPTRKTVRLDNVRYSQKDAGGRMRDGRTISEVADEMRNNGWDHTRDPPDMVDWGDGELQTLDHRRILAAQEAGLEEIPANIHPANERLPAELQERFTFERTFTDPETGQTYHAGDLPSTWGEAAMGRAAKQGDGFPLRGTVEPPRIRGTQ